MVGGTGFSWADEVEKEEALQSQIKQKEEEESFRKKPNPFGSARPREVVLQERGIDWRNLDTSFHSTDRIPGKENRPKQRRPTSMTPKKYFPLVSHRVPKGHQAAIQGTNFTGSHHALPVPAANAYLLAESSRTRTAEANQCPQIDASFLGEMQRPSCKPVHLGSQSSPFAAVSERQVPQMFDKFLERRFCYCYGHLELNHIEDQNSPYPKNYVEKTRDGPRDLRHTTVLGGLNPERAHFTGNHKKRNVRSTTEMHPTNQRRRRR